MKPRAAFIAIALLCGATFPARAQQSRDALPPEWTPLPRARLDAMRGGYALPSGLTASFGIERAVFVNGALVASTRVQLDDIGRMSADDARALAQAIAPIVVRNGDGNTGAIGTLPNGALLIQNSLDNQSFQSLTTFNVGVDTLGLFQTLNANTALQDAITLGGVR